jgi:hypothetical protein
MLWRPDPPGLQSLPLAVGCRSRAAASGQVPLARGQPLALEPDSMPCACQTPARREVQ